MGGMMTYFKRFILALLVLVFIVISGGFVIFAGGNTEQIFFPKIDRHPPPADYNRGAMTSVPEFDPDSKDPWQMDLRAFDLTALDLSGSLKDLLQSSFDDQTAWPPNERIPQGFDWKRILELGKDPGLGVRGLHARGINGTDVGIAIIDQTLLVDHDEYKERLRLYEETDDITGGWLRSQMHGPAVASIAVGRSVGAAPGADLYYIATAFGGDGKDFTYLADGIRRFLEINQQLPEGRKIRVIAAAIGWRSNVEGYDELVAAVEDAKAQGMLLVCSSMEQVHGFRFHGLGRAPLSDPGIFRSYEPGSWWAERFYTGKTASNRLLIPMDSRTTASPLGSGGYVFYRQGGWSWSIPYIAGVYALAAQVDPGITPERFWSLALRTGKTIELSHDGKMIPLGPIVDPVTLVDALQGK